MWKRFGSDKPPQSAAPARGKSLTERPERETAANRSSCSRLTSRRSPFEPGTAHGRGQAPEETAALTTAASRGGCRTKPFRKGRCTLAEAGAREAERDEIAALGRRAMEVMAVFGAHP